MWYHPHFLHRLVVTVVVSKMMRLETIGHSYAIQMRINAWIDAFVEDNAAYCILMHQLLSDEYM